MNATIVNYDESAPGGSNGNKNYLLNSKEEELK
jgi:hypothetical protein